MGIKDDLVSVSQKLGTCGQAEGIILKRGCLKGAVALEAKDVLGFDCIIYNDDCCYEYYVANPPLIGMTQPKPVQYPLGLDVINEYKIDYEEAIGIFKTGNWGSGFTTIELKKPLHPQVKEPYWYFMSSLGAQVIIGANSGKVLND